MILQKLFDENNIKYFTALEVLNCSGTKKYSELHIPADLMQNILPTIKVLDEIREWYNHPIHLNCTYRDLEHNTKVNGEKNSIHLLFNAIDFSVLDHNQLKTIYNHIAYLDNVRHFNFLPKIGSMGLGLYKTFIHIDTRATLQKKAPARWNA